MSNATLDILTLSAFRPTGFPCHIPFPPSRLLLFPFNANSALNSFAGARIVLGILAADGEPAPMANTAVTADFHQPLHVQ